MARYLSPEWFAALPSDPAATPEAVLEQVVEDTPEGTVTYRVEVAGGAAHVRWPVQAEAPSPDLRVTCSWATATAMARGELSSQQALAEGRLRVKGNLVRVAEVSDLLAGVDPVPATVRATTTY